MAYSNDGAYLAVIDEKKCATAFSVADGYSVNVCLSSACGFRTTQYLVLVSFCQTHCLFAQLFLTFFFCQVKNEFYGHHAKPVSLAWSPDNEHFATGGMDMMVYVWQIDDADKRIKLPGKACNLTCVKDEAHLVQCWFKF